MVTPRQFHDLVTQVQNHLALLKEDGLRALPFERAWTPTPLPSARRPPASTSPAAPAPQAGASKTPARVEEATPTLTEGVMIARARRLASCKDPGDPARHEVLVCSVVETFEQPAPRKLLDKILRAIGYEIIAVETERDVAAVLAAHPPAAIIAMGDRAVSELSSRKAPLRLIRGKWDKAGQVAMMPTFAPGYLLDHEQAKYAVWHDMQNLAARLGLALPPRPKK